MNQPLTDGSHVFSGLIKVQEKNHKICHFAIVKIGSLRVPHLFKMSYQILINYSPIFLDDFKLFSINLTWKSPYLHNFSEFVYS